MARFDGTGPRGEGSFSGRGMGYCIKKLDSQDSTVQNSDGEEVFDMPRGDGTGPMGMGPMTGRGAGYCAGYSTPGYMNPMPGRGFGQGGGFYGRGGGRGRRNRYYATGLPGWTRVSMGMPAFNGAYPYAAATPPTQEVDILKKIHFMKGNI